MCVCLPLSHVDLPHSFDARWTLCAREILCVRVIERYSVCVSERECVCVSLSLSFLLTYCTQSMQDECCVRESVVFFSCFFLSVQTSHQCAASWVDCLGGCLSRCKLPTEPMTTSGGVSLGADYSPSQWLPRGCLSRCRLHPEPMATSGGVSLGADYSPSQWLSRGVSLSVQITPRANDYLGGFLSWCRQSAKRESHT